MGYMETYKAWCENEYLMKTHVQNSNQLQEMRKRLKTDSTRILSSEQEDLEVLLAMVLTE